MHIFKIETPEVGWDLVKARQWPRICEITWTFRPHDQIDALVVEDRTEDYVDVCGALGDVRRFESDIDNPSAWIELFCSLLGFENTCCENISPIVI